MDYRPQVSARLHTPNQPLICARLPAPTTFVTPSCRDMSNNYAPQDSLIPRPSTMAAEGLGTRLVPRLKFS